MLYLQHLLLAGAGDPAEDLDELLALHVVDPLHHSGEQQPHPHLEVEFPMNDHFLNINSVPYLIYI